MIKLKAGMIVHCKNARQAKEFIKLAFEQGFKWHIFKKDITFWDTYKMNTIYFLCNDYKIQYGNIVEFDFGGDEVTDYTDLVKERYAILTKKDLENGMVVETRMGGMYLVHNDRLLNEKGIGHMNLYKQYNNDYEYNEDLTRPSNNEYDIIRVYKSDVYNLSDMFEKDNLELIWERKEQPTLSEKDKKVIKKGLKKIQEECNRYKSCNGCTLKIDGECSLRNILGLEVDKLFKD